MIYILYFLSFSAQATTKSHCKSSEVVVFSCELQTSSKNPRREVLSYCTDKNFTYLQLRLGPVSAPHYLLPKDLKDSLTKFAFGMHTRPGGHSVALAFADPGVLPAKEWTLDAGFETGQKGSSDTETQDYSLDITEVEKETSQEQVCVGAVDDHIDSASNHVRRLDYFQILEGILPRKENQIDEVAAAKALLKELQEEKSWLKKLVGEYFSLNEALFQHGLTLDIDGDGKDDHLFFVQNVDIKKIESHFKNLRIVKAQTSGNFSQGLLFSFSSTKSQPELIYFTGLEEFKLKNFRSEQFASIKQSEIDASYLCKSDGLVADTPSGDFIICKTSAKPPQDYLWKKAQTNP